jgi:hypothetical protein
MLEVAIESEDIASIELIGQMDEASVGEIGWSIAIFAHQFTNLWSMVAETEWNAKGALFDASQDAFYSRSRVAENVKRFCHAGLTTDERPRQGFIGLDAPAMSRFSPIVEGHEEAGVGKDRGHLF